MHPNKKQQPVFFFVSNYVSHAYTCGGCCVLVVVVVVFDYFGAFLGYRMTTEK